MYALLIENDYGVVREWFRGKLDTLLAWTDRLPRNGWRFHSIKRLD